MGQFPVGVIALGITCLGSTAAIRDDTPDTGPVPWGRGIQDPGGTAEYDMSDESQLGHDN